MTNISDMSETARIDQNKSNALATVALSSATGGLGFSDMAQVMQFARVMAASGSAVPEHLRGNVGACMAITIQAVEWRLSPFAVANKSYEVNDRIAYESQLVQAVILQRAPIKGRFTFEFKGEGQRRQCTVSATVLPDGYQKSYTSPEIGSIKVQNSPLWKNDPDQQLAYYSGRALCRRHFPDVLLGIYTPEELAEEIPQHGPENACDVTPRQTLAEKLDALAIDHRKNIPVQDAKPMIGADEGQESAIGQTGSANPPTGASEAINEVPANGSVPSDNQPLSDGLAAEHRQQKDAGTAIETRQESPASDLILDAGRAAATNGSAAFQKWWRRLSAADAERLTPHVSTLREAAKFADARGA